MNALLNVFARLCVFRRGPEDMPYAPPLVGILLALWIAQGKTNREIGQILSLSPRTVNKHLEQVFRKLGVENRTAAAAMALRCLTRT